MAVLAASVDVYQFLLRGGWFMAPLVVCSFVSMAVMFVRGLALRRKYVVPPEIEKEVDLLRQEDHDGVARLARLVRNDPSAMGRIVSTALHHLNWPKSENMEAVQTRARHEVVRLEGGLFVLEIIVGIAPLLGLLGAVSGLMSVFGAFGSDASKSDPHVIASGISEALTTTIVGLAVAIPSLIAYSYFSKKVETMAAEMESVVADLLAKCYFRKRPLTARITEQPEPVGYEGMGE